jgi:exosortase/archaeosortase family protein
MSKSGYFKKLILLLSAIPIALIANIIRIIILAFANDIYGKEVLSGFFHDFSGFLMFAFALLALSAISSLLDKNKDSRQAQ